MKSLIGKTYRELTGKSRFHTIVSALLRMFFRLFFRIKITGMENVPKTGKLILCSNHKTSFDPIFYMAFFPRQPFFMGKNSAFENYLIASFLKRMGAFPVARGQHDEKAIKNALAILREEKVLGMFLEGKRVKENIKVQAKKGTGLIAMAANAPLIPAALIADFTFFSKVRCKIGAPICLSNWGTMEHSNDVYYKISNDVLNSIYKLVEE